MLAAGLDVVEVRRRRDSRPARGIRTGRVGMGMGIWRWRWRGRECGVDRRWVTNVKGGHKTTAVQCKVLLLGWLACFLRYRPALDVQFTATRIQVVWAIPGA
jgi:hypothetical protein